LTHDPYAALRVHDFRWLLFGHAALTFAREAQIVVIGWQIFEATGDPLALGLIGLAEAIPLLGFALFAGHVADRIPRRPIAIAGALGMLISGVALFGITLRGELVPWIIYALIFVSGIGRAFVRPAVSALGAEVITRELYPNAVAWRSSTWHLAAIAGPAAGGMIYGFSGPVAAYGVVVVLMLISLAAFSVVRHRARPVAPEEEPVLESIKAGLRFVYREPVLLAAMTLDLFSVLFGGATALLPVFAKMLQAGPQGLGILRAAPAIGSIGVGIYLAHRPPLRRTGVVLLVSVALFGASMIAFALSRNFFLSFLLLLFGGAADGVSVVIRGTLLQTRAPQHLLGRVSSVNQIFISASNEIGAFESGVAARLLGVVPSVLFGGFMTLVVVALTAFWSPQLRKLREGP
jgi:predicted MFS family arabinose efflux permease